MPDRILRDELLDSDRYLSLGGPRADAARLVFLHLIMVADDLGNAEATPLFMSRKLWPRKRSEEPVSDDEVDAVLAMLVAVDLIRLYVANEKRYVHIPRWRQRLRSYKRVNPRPPAGIECKEIRALLAELSDKRAHVPDTSPQPPSHAVKEGRKEGSSINKNSTKKRQQPPVPVDKSHPKEEPKAGPVQLREVLKGNGIASALTPPWFTSPEGIAREARIEGISSPPGEAADDLKTRIFAVKAARQRNAQ